MSWPGWQSLVQSRRLNGVLSRLNGIPFPYARFPVRVRGHRFTADSLDRQTYLLLQKFGWMDAPALDMLAGLCRPGAFVLDVGANLGVFTLALARAVGNDGSVWAIEADPENHGLLLRNLAANPSPQVTAWAVMAGAAGGEGVLYRSPSNHGDHRCFDDGEGRAGVTVPRVALDDLVPAGKPVDLVKLDVQGYEEQVVAGMRRILEESPGIRIFFEFWPYGLSRAGTSGRALLSRLGNLGFRFDRVDERKRRFIPAEPDELLSAVTGSSYVNLLAQRPGRA